MAALCFVMECAFARNATFFLLLRQIVVPIPADPPPLYTFCSSSSYLGTYFGDVQQKRLLFANHKQIADDGRV